MDYDEAFFDLVQRGAARSAVPFLTHIIETVLDGQTPTSVLDVGCGPGAWLAEWRRQGAGEVVGVDGDYVPREKLAIPADDFRAIDISQPFDLGRRFDLVMSLEVAEHVAEEHADTVIDSICRHGDIVMFSAAIPRQGGVNHVNEQPYDYWRAKFAARGYAVFDCARQPLVNLSEIEPWYRFNTFVYANKDGQSRLSQAALDEAVADRVPLRVPLRWRMECFLRSRGSQCLALFR